MKQAAVLMFAGLLSACPRAKTVTALPDVVALCNVLDSSERDIIAAGTRELGLEPVSITTMYASSVKIMISVPALRATASESWGPGTHVTRTHFDDPYSEAHAIPSLPQCVVFADGDETHITSVIVRNDH